MSDKEIKSRFEELVDAGIVRKTNIVVWELTDYSYLENLSGNREVLDRASKIIQSVKTNGLRPIPCLLNKNMEKVDGQARGIAFKELGLPYRFIVEENAGLKECVSMNQSSTAWKLADYVHSFAVQGKKDYIELERLLKEYSEFSVPAVIFAASGKIESANKSIKNGEYNTVNRLVDDPAKALDFVNEMRATINLLKGVKSKAEEALIFAYAIDYVDKERMIRMFSDYGYSLKSYSSMEDWLNGISEIYNKNLKKNHIDLVYEYKSAMEGRLPWYAKKWGNKQ